MNFNFNFGEMTVYEREKLYNYIVKYNPSTVLECGSGVGASTYVIVNALSNNSSIYSCDPSRSPNFTSEKLNFYSLPSNLLILYLIDNEISPDFIFFDGPEDPKVALDDFIVLDKFVNIGTIFSMHDWCLTTRKLDNGLSTKAALLKPYIQSSNNWELIEEAFGEDYKVGEESVGLCFYKKIL